MHNVYRAPIDQICKTRGKARRGWQKAATRFNRELIVALRLCRELRREDIEFVQHVKAGCLDISACKCGDDREIRVVYLPTSDSIEWYNGYTGHENCPTLIEQKNEDNPFPVPGADSSNVLGEAICDTSSVDRVPEETTSVLSEDMTSKEIVSVIKDLTDGELVIKPRGISKAKILERYLKWLEERIEL